VIAEAGVNHNGSVDLAEKLIDAATDAGADCVKFQTFIAEKLVTTTAKKANYQMKEVSGNEAQFSMLKKLELSSEAHALLTARCGEKDVEFMSTGFDEQSVDFLASLGVHRLKIPSGEITNLPYLRHLGRTGLPIIMSTGMATLDEIGAALDALESTGYPRRNVTLLHCNTEYPTPVDDVNLKAMSTLRETFGIEVGYSDHTLGIEVPIAAVALGATVIEKHLTLDRTLPGPDHGASLEPAEFKEMVRAIRSIEQALGDGVKKPSPSEAKNIPIVRRSIVASRAIGKGEVFSERNVTTKRPGTGISPMNWDDVIGRAANRDFHVDELIEL
jgi:N,N'-diacetyllegionaminate synthase